MADHMPLLKRMVRKDRHTLDPDITIEALEKKWQAFEERTGKRIRAAPPQEVPYIVPLFGRAP